MYHLRGPSPAACAGWPASRLRVILARSSPPHREDDQFLLAFLRARKYKVAASHEVLRKFTRFWFNPAYAHILDGLDPEALRGFCREASSRLLPYARDIHGNAVCLLFAGQIEPALAVFDDTVRMGILFLVRARLCCSYVQYLDVL